jgi:hypothetical protein
MVHQKPFIVVVFVSISLKENSSPYSGANPNDSSGTTPMPPKLRHLTRGNPERPFARSQVHT